MKKIFIWVTVIILGFSLLSFLFGKPRTSNDTVTSETQKTVLTKEQFDVYNNIYLDLEKLQKEYEDMYAKYGYVEQNKYSQIDDYPRYGSLTRKITSVRDTIPKIKTSMTQEERDLSLYLSAYGTSLIFLTPSPEGIATIDEANESKATIDKMLNDIKQKYDY